MIPLFFRDPQSVWAAVVVGSVVAFACLMVGVLSVWLLLRQFLRRHDQVVEKYESLFRKMEVQQDSSDEALRLQGARLDSVRRRQESVDDWRAKIGQVMENHEDRLKRLEGRT